MHNLFSTYLEISICFTPIVIILLFASPVLQKKYTTRVCHLNWILVCIFFLAPIRIICAFLIESSAPVFTFSKYIENTPLVETLNEITKANESFFMNQQTLHSEQSYLVADILLTTWIAGVMISIIYHTYAYFFTLHRLKRWSIPMLNKTMIDNFSIVKSEYKIKKTIGLFQTNEISSPMILGLINPRILVPVRDMNNQESLYVLKHEICHYVRRDLWFKLLLLIVSVLHWYNPVVYMMIHQAETDMELACDSRVLYNADSDSRRQYGLTILSFIGESRLTHTPLTTCFYGGKKTMTKRFINMLSCDKRRTGISIFVLVVFSLVIFGTFLGAKVHASLPETEVNMQTNSDDMTWPVPSFYSIEKAVSSSPSGLAIPSDLDSTVVAAEDGVVSHVNSVYQPGLGYGIYIVIDHENNTTTLYGHLNAVNVEVGEVVKKGQSIGQVGSTGYSDYPHLQFEVRVNDTIVDALKYLKA